MAAAAGYVNSEDLNARVPGGGLYTPTGAFSDDVIDFGDRDVPVRLWVVQCGDCQVIVLAPGFLAMHPKRHDDRGQRRC